MSDVFLTGKPGGIDAWVSIGLTGNDTAPARAAALRRVPDADRFFSGRERGLVEQVSRLLDRALP